LKIVTERLDLGEMDALAHELREPGHALQCVGPRGDAPPAEAGGRHAGVRGEPGVERLRHRPEVRLNPAGQRRRDAERVAELLLVEPEEGACSRERSEDADRTRGMPALGEEGAAHRGTDAEAELESRDDGREELGAGPVLGLADRERRRDRGCGGMVPPTCGVRVVEI
jgi:hypothetical protein